MGQKVADFVAKTIRSWTFVIFQVIFIAVWITINRNNPSIAWDNRSFDILRLVIAIESSSMTAAGDTQEAVVPVRGFLQTTQSKIRKWEMWLLCVI